MVQLPPHLCQELCGQVGGISQQRHSPPRPHLHRTRTCALQAPRASKHATLDVGSVAAGRGRSHCTSVAPSAPKSHEQLALHASGDRQNWPCSVTASASVLLIRSVACEALAGRI